MATILSLFLFVLLLAIMLVTFIMVTAVAIIIVAFLITILLNILSPILRWGKYVVTMVTPIIRKNKEYFAVVSLIGATAFIAVFIVFVLYGLQYVGLFGCIFSIAGTLIGIVNKFYKPKE